MRREAGQPVPLSWGVDAPATADPVIAENQMDLVMVVRARLADPHWPYHARRAMRFNQCDPPAVY